MRCPGTSVRRAYTLQLRIFTSLSAVPFEYLEFEPTGEFWALAAARGLVRFSLDLLSATENVGIRT